MKPCNCYSQKRQIMNVFEQYLQLRIKFLCFAHIPIPTCRFWRGMSVNIIWIWINAIVLDQKWCFLESFPLWIKILWFAHIPIPSWPFWGSMRFKIIWIWHTAIVIAKYDQKWCFLGMISALNKICMFCAYPHPKMLILKRYEY